VPSLLPTFSTLQELHHLVLALDTNVDSTSTAIGHGSNIAALDTEMATAVSATLHLEALVAEKLLTVQAHDNLTALKTVFLVTGKARKYTALGLHTIRAKRIVARGTSEAARRARNFLASNTLVERRVGTRLAIRTGTCIAENNLVVAAGTLGLSTADTDLQLDGTISSKTEKILAVNALIRRHTSDVGNKLP